MGSYPNRWAIVYDHVEYCWSEWINLYQIFNSIVECVLIVKVVDTEVHLSTCFWLQFCTVLFNITLQNVRTESVITFEYRFNSLGLPGIKYCLKVASTLIILTNSTGSWEKLTTLWLAVCSLLGWWINSLLSCHPTLRNALFLCYAWQRKIVRPFFNMIFIQCRIIKISFTP